MPFDCMSGCDDALPAQNISWNHAVEFMNELTRMENQARPSGRRLTPCYERDGDSWKWMKKDCTGYRLPTESEWEYFARAGTTTAYAFGNDPGELCKHANGADRALWRQLEKKDLKDSGGLYFLACDDKAVDLARVGTYASNPWGLYDVHGNVSEWVWDWFGKYPAEMTPVGYDGPPTGMHRVARGGSWKSSAVVLRSAFRVGELPSFADNDFGFRCVRSVGPPEPPSSP